MPQEEIPPKNLYDQLPVAEDPSSTIFETSATEIDKPGISTTEEKNMEVHKHPHHVTHKKKWGEYLLEFLMIFLAVTLGFIAENIRENISENAKANELAKNLYKELHADSINVQRIISLRNVKEHACTYVINYVKDSNLNILPPLFYPAFTNALVQSQQIFFEPADGILNQLRNSGELRYFKSSVLQEYVGKLSVMITNIRTRNDKEYSYIENQLRPFSLAHYDFDWYEAFTQNGKITMIEAQNQNRQLPYEGKIISPQTFDRQKAENIISYYLLMLRGTRQNQYVNYITVNHEVLEALRKEYHLNKE
jgi:hypothetical protein